MVAGAARDASESGAGFAAELALELFCWKRAGTRSALVGSQDSETSNRPFKSFSADHVGSNSEAAPAAEFRADPLGVTDKSSSTAMLVGAPPVEDEVRANALSRALSEFLLGRANSGPLIISVEGEWGCEKSSFLLTLEQHLRQRSRAKTAEGIAHNVPLIAKFNCGSRKPRND
jgi:hypothetical protein